MKNIFCTGYCKTNRISAISEIQKIVTEFGYITDFKQFSDISSTIVIEVEERKINSLYLAIKEFMHLNDFELLNSDATIERVILMNTTFSDGTGDLRIETPAVPG
jgi:hypothetical protein